VTEAEELAGRFAAVYTGAITDVLDRGGYLQQTLPASIRPLREGMRLAGPAFPVEGRPRPGVGYDESVRTVLSVTSLNGRGCAGAVIDGGCRDVEYILREDFPVFCRYTTPQDCVGRWEIVTVDSAVTIGGVRVAPGDYVVADRDGVVVIPGEAVETVLAEAEQLVGTENEIRRAVRDGVLPLEAYERFRTF
jgi:4-hydroxy-4-methyl-2-oxoglutarate aldolase